MISFKISFYFAKAAHYIIFFLLPIYIILLKNLLWFLFFWNKYLFCCVWKAKNKNKHKYNTNHLSINPLLPVVMYNDTMNSQHTWGLCQTTLHRWVSGQVVVHHMNASRSGTSINPPYKDPLQGIFSFFPHLTPAAIHLLAPYVNKLKFTAEVPL